jgi:hypothetical protein
MYLAKGERKKKNEIKTRRTHEYEKQRRGFTSLPHVRMAPYVSSSKTISRGHFSHGNPAFVDYISDQFEDGTTSPSQKFVATTDGGGKEQGYRRFTHRVRATEPFFITLDPPSLALMTTISGFQKFRPFSVGSIMQKDQRWNIGRPKRRRSKLRDHVN